MEDAPYPIHPRLKEIPVKNPAQKLNLFRTGEVNPSALLLIPTSPAALCLIARSNTFTHTQIHTYISCPVAPPTMHFLHVLDHARSSSADQLHVFSCLVPTLISIIHVNHPCCQMDKVELTVCPPFMLELWFQPAFSGYPLRCLCLP